MRERNQTLRKKAFERDGFTCQKCKIQDKTERILEAHHITPLVMNGEDILGNLITLCNDCHHFAPNNQSDFNEYIKEESDGTLTTLIKSFNKVHEEHPELFEKLR
jgi:5-methylcytosine-specific restriction endonuclease McrA